LNTLLSSANAASGLDASWSLSRRPKDRRPSITAVMGDPAVSDWVKDSIETLLRGDCVDAANDADLLAAVMWRPLR
jgi:hypothetical protein